MLLLNSLQTIRVTDIGSQRMQPSKRTTPRVFSPRYTTLLNKGHLGKLFASLRGDLLSKIYTKVAILFSLTHTGSLLTAVFSKPKIKIELRV